MPTYYFGFQRISSMVSIIAINNNSNMVYIHLFMINQIICLMLATSVLGHWELSSLSTMVPFETVIESTNQSDVERWDQLFSKQHSPTLTKNQTGSSSAGQHHQINHVEHHSHHNPTPISSWHNYNYYHNRYGNFFASNPKQIQGPKHSKVVDDKKLSPSSLSSSSGLASSIFSLKMNPFSTIGNSRKSYQKTNELHKQLGKQSRTGKFETSSNNDDGICSQYHTSCHHCLYHKHSSSFNKHQQQSQHDCLYLICERRNFCIESNSPLLKYFNRFNDSRIHCRIWDKCPTVKRSSYMKSFSSPSSLLSSFSSSSQSFFSAGAYDGDKKMSNRLLKHSLRYHNHNRGNTQVANVTSSNEMIDKKVPITSQYNNYLNDIRDHNRYYRHFFTSAIDDGSGLKNGQRFKTTNAQQQQHGFVQAIRQIGDSFTGRGVGGIGPNRYDIGSSASASSSLSTLSSSILSNRYHALVYHISFGTILALMLCSFLVLSAVIIVAYKKIRKIYTNHVCNAYGTLQEETS